MMTAEEYLIVDGYNIINDWPEFAALREQDLAHARHALIQILVNYQALSGEQVIVVFDAHLAKGGEKTMMEKGVRITYTRQGETADHVIEKLVYQLPAACRVTVATSDWLEQRLVMGKGALRLAARELRMLVLDLGRASQQHYEQGQKYFTLSGRLGEDVYRILEKLRRC